MPAAYREELAVIKRCVLREVTVDGPSFTLVSSRARVLPIARRAVAGAAGDEERRHEDSAEGQMAVPKYSLRHPSSNN
eukprot:scaffold18154_cov92-Isochrysis_galbana.AAC.5